MAIQISGVKATAMQVSRLMRPSDENIIFGSTEKFRKDTGWKPTRTLEQTLASMFEYWDGYFSDGQAMQKQKKRGLAQSASVRSNG
jgi:nucleoside-diphosphate-sugar epimerase